MTVIIAGTITIDAANHDAIMQAAITMMEATRKEAGCIEYVFSADPQDRAVLRLYEKWDTAEHLGPHMSAPHMAVWRQKSAELGVLDRDITLYEVASQTPL